jgi:hypothetical protein
MFMLLIRRFLVVFALMFWMGGFMFYGAVVVPTNRIELKDMPQRGTITQLVTEWMNFAGTLALLVLFVDTYASTAGRQPWRWSAWAGMVIPHLFLIWLHSELTKQMAAPGFHQSNMKGFLIWHRVYLITNTVQWFFGMVFLGLTLRQWRREDRSEDKTSITVEKAPAVQQS